MNAENQKPGPLVGVRVVEMSIWMAGSVAGMLLADLGADVVKVESRNGDPTRNHVASTAGSQADEPDMESITYSTCNRNKRSISLDAASEPDRQVLNDLLRKSDVFLTNLSPATIRKLGIDEDTVRKINPGLVYAQSAGLGTVGPRADDPAQDMTGMAYAGMLFTMSSRPGEPFCPPGAVNDVLTGTMVAFGIVAALMRRRETGAGESVSGSLVQTALWSQMLLLGSLANTEGAEVQGQPREDPRIPTLNQYKAGDGRWIAVAAINERAWPALVGALGPDPIFSDERFASFPAMMRNRQAMRVELDRIFATRTAAAWLEHLRSLGVWCGPVNELGDVLVDQHIAENKYLTKLSDGRRTVRMPFDLIGYTPRTAAGPPLDSGRDSVLSDWGVTESLR
jgi:crotonobetainyl-CoA:carnitine CoA-transferase CaiB-like acyl-CoA transferase